MWFQDMLKTVCNYSILKHKRINYKICFVFQGVDNTGVFYKSCDKVAPLEQKQYFFIYKIICAEVNMKHDDDDDDDDNNNNNNNNNNK